MGSTGGERNAFATGRSLPATSVRRRISPCKQCSDRLARRQPADSEIPVRNFLREV